MFKSKAKLREEILAENQAEWMAMDAMKRLEHATDFMNQALELAQEMPIAHRVRPYTVAGNRRPACVILGYWLTGRFVQTYSSSGQQEI